MLGRFAALASACLLVAGQATAQPYTNFESSHVHPIALTPSAAQTHTGVPIGVAQTLQ